MAPAVLATPRSPAHKEKLMDTSSVAYVLCRIEDDSSLTPVSQHGDFLTGIAAGRLRGRGRGLRFRLRPLLRRSLQRVVHTRVASFREGRIGYRLWATRTGRISPSVEDRLRPRRRRAYGMISWPLQERVPTRSAPACDASRGACTTCSAVRGWLASGARALAGGGLPLP